MNRSAILVLTFVFSSVLIVFGTNICDNAPCEAQINASLGKEFTISLESNPSTGFEWWTKFDPNYLTLSNSTFISGKKLFTFDARSGGNTEVIMLLLKPWENGAVAERKIFPINVMSTTIEPRQATILGKSVNSVPVTTMKHLPGNVPIYLPNESVMETPSQAIPSQIEPSRYDLSSFSQKSI